MKIPDNIRKCVFFIGYKTSETTYGLAGTGFALANQGDTVSYIVTARHVIDTIKEKQLIHACLRVNKVNGDAVWFETDIEKWRVHKSDASVDVAIYSCEIGTDIDLLRLSFEHGATERTFRRNDIGLGDEVFVTGLFKHHYGTKRNIPIVRIGNLACLTEEKVTTKKYGEIDAYLIEARSIGGLSGSPVYLNNGAVRISNGSLTFPTGRQQTFLLGLIHGHYDSESGDIDSVDQTDATGISTEKINNGIAIVVPYHKIKEVIDQTRVEDGLGLITHHTEDESPP